MSSAFAKSLLASLVALLAVGCSKPAEAPQVGAAEGTPPATAPGPALVVPKICQDAKNLCGQLSQCAVAPITAAQATIPAQPCTFQGEADPQTQEFVDIYSWNIFLALSWPASLGSCAADPSKSISGVQSGDGTFAVWQTYMPSENVFVNPGTQKPAAWCSGNSLAAGPERVFNNEAKSVAAAKALNPAFAAISEPGGDVLQASGDVVTDQSQRWLRYERLMNQTEYNYIVPNRWNSVQLQAMFNGGQAITIPKGSIELKSSWKVLTSDEIRLKKYFTTTGIVCNTPDGKRTPCNAKPVTMGLVGLHIVHQVNDGGTMFWSTFEHVDNDTVFFNPGSSAKPNTDFAQQPFTELDANCKGINPPTQIKRVTPVAAAPALNDYYRQLLAGSVYANYRLISTQWTTGVGVTRLGTPQYVANTTLETYVQTFVSPSGPTKGATGCMGCHLGATTNIKNASGQFQDSNHSFLFLESQFATMKPRK